jgi:hypothetical protein
LSGKLQQQDFKKSMKSNKDEMYTPPILVKPIIEYIPKDKTIWCPFDTESSEYVIQFRQSGYKVIYSHLIYNQNFFYYEPDEPYDYIISNPPFSVKLDILERLYKLGKPFAMLLGLPILNYQEIGNFFHRMNSDLELLIFDKKVSFDGNTSSFNTSYFCRNVLKDKLQFYNLPHNNTGKNFVGSKMILK